MPGQTESQAVDPAIGVLWPEAAAQGPFRWAEGGAAGGSTAAFGCRDGRPLALVARRFSSRPEVGDEAGESGPPARGELDWTQTNSDCRCRHRTFVRPRRPRPKAAFAARVRHGVERAFSPGPD